MADIKVVCKDCGEEFIMTPKEVQWYSDKGFKLPKRCPSCRKKRKADKNDRA